MRTNYVTTTLVPSWLSEDPGYLAGLREYLLNCMALQDYRIVVWPQVRDITHTSDAQVPVGFRLLTAEVVVEEFDVSM